MMILFTLMLMTVVIPLAGLAIDLTIMYIVQAKLWEAVDGAGLEAGRLIGTTSGSIQSLAVQACQANFPSGYWASGPVTCTAVYNPGNVSNGYKYTVDVSASVTAPTLFMKVFQVPGVIVSSSAEASRRPTRVVMVLDRSGSMAALVSTLQTQASAFVKMFTPNFDELGFVAFGNTGIVGYPVKNPGPYNFNPTDTTGGPDTSFYSQQGGCCDEVYAINQMVSGGATNMSEGLSLAYIELQKAHYRDFGLTNVDITNNVIVLFTDGVPNMFSAYLNSPDQQGNAMTVAGYPVPNVTSPGNSLLKTRPMPYNTPYPAQQAGSSECKYNYNYLYPNPVSNNQSAGNANGITLATAQAAANQMIGIIGSGCAPSSFTCNFGLVQMASLDTSYGGGSGSNAWSMHWIGNDEGGQTLTAIRNTNPVTNCNNLGNGHATNPDFSNGGIPDVASIPPWDLYGNLTTDMVDVTGAKQGHTVSSATSFPKTTAYSGTIGTNDGNNGVQLNIAAWNTVDNAANRIRSDMTTMKVIIYTIGYSGNGGTDDVLLARVANDPKQLTTYGSKNSTAFNSSQRQGQYFPASTSNAIADAFAKIAGMVLNLTR
jgi:hypothetical protein